MTKLKIETDSWIVVCDGKKALILENVGDAKFPNLRVKEVHEQADPRTSEQGTGAPGRVFASVGTARSSVEQTDWHDEAERTFLGALVQELNSAVLTGKTKGIVLVAPPRALGMMRKAWPPAHHAAIKGELPHDYVKLPIHEIEKRLFG